MAGSINKAALIGNLGRDPEIRSTQDGREVASFSIATSESWKDKTTGERREKTEWHRIVVFNEKLVGVIKSYVKKGTKVYIEGAIQTRKWQDKSGTDHYTTEIVLQAFNGTLVMLSGKEATQSHDYTEPQTSYGATPEQQAQRNQNHLAGSYSAYTGQQAPSEIIEEIDDEIPF